LNSKFAASSDLCNKLKNYFFQLGGDCGGLSNEVNAILPHD